MDKFIPDMYQKSIHDIDYKNLKKRGIKCLIFDLDNTIAPLSTPVPTKEIKDLFSHLNILGFKVIILSNALKSRVEPFKEKLNVDASFKAHKPSKKKYLKIMNIYNYKITEMACIGDQIFTDIYGANRIGCTSILVNPISNIDYFWTKLFRFFEKKLFKKLEKKGLFKLGEYYD